MMIPMPTEIAVPSPTAVRASWWPAAIRIPGEEQPRTSRRIYATPEGLYVFARPGGEPDWWSPLLPDQDRPATNWTARNGVYLMTAAGQVTITLEGGCGCGNPLKRWTPDFAGQSVPW
jgi:hypothetical protein